MRPGHIWSLVLNAWLLLFSLAHSAEPAADYSELLTLRTLPNSHLLASFDFRSEASTSSFDHQHFRFLPRALSQILQYTHTNELHLRFSSGRWDEGSWGSRPRQGIKEGGTGVELWAWVEADTPDEAEARWLSLTNTLSGLFCASLNFIDSTRTVRPRNVFSPSGSILNSTSQLHLLHGQLAREVVCTENLTPFLKLIPCKGKAGISSLFDGHKLFDAAWQSMAIDIWPSCDKAGCSIFMDQSVDMVLDIERSKRPRDDPIPRPVDVAQLSCDGNKPYNAYGDSCFPQRTSTVSSFNLTDVFGRPIKGTCPLSSNSDTLRATLCVERSVQFKLSTNTTGAYSEEVRNATTRCFKMPVGADFDIQFGAQTVLPAPTLDLTSLKVERSFSGKGQERGGSQSVFINSSPTANVSCVYMESLPWFMKPYLHTLRAEIHESGRLSGAERSIQNIHYVPAIDRVRGTHLELELSVPPLSTLTLTYEFDKAVLRYTEYPPDPNRGFDISPAVVRVLDSQKVEHGFLRTNGLVLYLPTPDFSMPYNVIILTSTVIALGFGSIFNIVVRRLVSVEEARGLDETGLRGRMQAAIGRVKARVKGGNVKSKAE